jgi:hypothetical protein
MKCAVNTSYCLIEVVTKAGLTTYLVLIVFVGYKSVDYFFSLHFFNFHWKYIFCTLKIEKYASTGKLFHVPFFSCIGGVMISVLALSVVDHAFEPWSDQTKDYKIGICCFSAKHTALRWKSKDWLARNQDNVSEWGDTFICGLLFRIIKI